MVRGSLARACGGPSGILPDVEHGVTSAIAEVETLRTLDRLRLGGSMEPRQLGLAARPCGFEVVGA